jgi:very-short-patch-repair endonuclease
VDGDSHFIEAAQRRDETRTRALESLGVRVVRFTNREVMEAFEGVCMEIRRALENC